MEGTEGSVKGGMSCWALCPGHSGSRDGAEGEAVQQENHRMCFPEGATLMPGLGTLCFDTKA